jgi:hypothetical protein
MMMMFEWVREREQCYNTCAKKKINATHIFGLILLLWSLNFFFVSGLRGIFSSLSYFGYHHSTASANKSERTHGGENVVKKLIILSLLFFSFFSFRFDSCNLAYSLHTQTHMAVGIYCCYSSFFWTIKFAEKWRTNASEFLYYFFNQIKYIFWLIFKIK